MKIICKHCGEIINLFDALEDADGRRFIELLQAIPAPLIKPYLRYLKLFKPAQRAMTWSRMLKLTQDLLPVLKTGNVKVDRMEYLVATPTLIDVLTVLVDTPPKNLKTPLKTHGYLLAMLSGAADKVEAQREKQTEQRLLHRTQDSAQSQPAPISDVLPKTSTTTSKPPAGWKEAAFSGGHKHDNDDD